MQKEVTVTPKSSSLWGNMPSDAQNNVNCAIYDSSAALRINPNSPYKCDFQLINNGLVGAEYTRMRWSAETTSTFWHTAENNWAMYGVSITKANS